MTVATWTRTADDEHAEKGVRYRTSIYLPKGTYSDTITALVDRALRLAKATIHQGAVELKRWDFFTPYNLPDNANIAQNEIPRAAWLVRLEWEKVKDATPVAVLVAAIALVVVAVTGWVIIATVTEKQAAAVGEGVKSAFDQLLSPGVVIAAMVVAGLYAMRRR